MNTQTIAMIGQILTQAEQFVAGQPITITLPNETVDLGGFKAVIGGSLTVHKA